MASNGLLYFSVKNFAKMKKIQIWRDSSNCKQTAENQFKKSKQTADKCKQIAEIS